VDPDYVWVNTVYDKGAWVVHMLRHVMGDSLFFEAARDYRVAHEYGNVTSDSLQVALEAAYGGSLDWFFDPWIYEPGWPQYAWAWDYTPSRQGYLVTLELRQEQPESEPLFIMPIDVRVTTAGGAQDFVVWNDARIQSFEVEVDEEPLDLLLDPDHWILREFVAFPTSVGEDLPVPRTETPSLSISPNPTRQATVVSFGLPEGGDVSIELYDVEGRLVRHWERKALPAGAHHVTWDGRDAGGRAVSPGIYFARMVTDVSVREGKLVLLH
jgi:hypothetical protein